MTITIRDFSIQAAFLKLEDEIKAQEIKGDLPENFEQFINAGNYKKICGDIEQFEGKGVIFGESIDDKGANPNQTKSVVHNFTVEGDKKWKSIYLGVYDSCHGPGLEVVEGSTKLATKKECIDFCRAVTEETGRSTFILIGKETVGYSRCMAEINYKPSPKQTYGSYQFIW